MFDKDSGYEMPDLTFLANDDEKEIAKANERFAKEVQDEAAKKEAAEFFLGFVRSSYPGESFKESWQKFREDVGK